MGARPAVGGKLFFTEPYGPQEPFFEKTWQPSEVELVP